MDPELIVRPNAPVGYEQFGTSVAISGGVAIVGAGNGSFNPGPGTAYIFTMDGAGVTQLAQLTPSDSIGLDYFGSAVAIDGNYAVVGARGAGTHGQAYVFAWNGSSWSEQALLTDSAASPSGGFGWSVAIHGDHAIIGANRVAYIFRRTGSNWVEEARLSPPPPQNLSSSFGHSVSLNGDRAIVVRGPRRRSGEHRRRTRGAAYFYPLAILPATDMGTQYEGVAGMVGFAARLLFMSS